jgi:hypothetical protein
VPVPPVTVLPVERYRLFGLDVASTHALPAPAGAAGVGHPDVQCVVDTDASLAPVVAARTMCRTDLARRDGAWVIGHSCTGEYTVSDDGACVTGRVAPGVTEDAVQLDLIGRVLPLVLGLRGSLCLHASAVAIGGSALAFVAPKGTGKSTLALALVAGGGVLLADDLTGLAPGWPARVLPGVTRVRVRTDALRVVRGWADVLGHALPEPAVEAIDDKVALPLGSEAAEPAPWVALDAVYVLEAAAPDTEGAAERHRLSPREAVAELLGHLKLGATLDRERAAVEFGRIIDLVARVPVYRLRIARRLERLPEVVAQVARWAEERGEVTS